MLSHLYRRYSIPLESRMGLPGSVTYLYILADAFDPGGRIFLDCFQYNLQDPVACCRSKSISTHNYPLSGLSRSPVGFGSYVSLSTLHSLRYLKNARLTIRWHWLRLSEQDFHLQDKCSFPWRTWTLDKLEEKNNV